MITPNVVEVVRASAHGLDVRTDARYVRLTNGRKRRVLPTAD